MDTSGGLVAVVGGAVRQAAALVLPTTCAGCSRPGGGWCRECRVGTRRPAPAPYLTAEGAPACWSATVLDGPVRAAVTAHKDGGRRDVGAVLVPLLASALSRAMAEDPVLRRARARGEPVPAVPVPVASAARRRRGDDPVGALAAAAAVAVDRQLLVPAAVLRHRRRVRDQSGLGRAERAANLHGALVVHPADAPVVTGRPCVLLDDVVTTGATLAEAARALRQAGAAHVVAATVAATPGRSSR